MIAYRPVREGWATPASQMSAHYIRGLVSLCRNVRLREHPTCGYHATLTRNNSCRKCRVLRALEEGRPVSKTKEN